MFTLEERTSFKQRIQDELRLADIPLFPLVREDDSKDIAILNEKLRHMQPFAVVGCNCIQMVAANPTRGRMTRFGFVEVENLAHCDFSALRDMLIKTHMQDLQEVSSFTKYEEFRRAKIVRRESN